MCLWLFCLRQIPTFEVLGLDFGVSKTETKDKFDYWLNMLLNILPASLLQQVKKNDTDYGITIKLFWKFQLIVDSMEQLIVKIF